jgi:hypothetical protein
MVVGAAVVIVWPLGVWLITGSVSTLGVIYAAEALVAIMARPVARWLGLPAWSASESYVSQLRRWRAERRNLSGDPPTSLPS